MDCCWILMNLLMTSAVLLADGVDEKPLVKKQTDEINSNGALETQDMEQPLVLSKSPDYPLKQNTTHSLLNFLNQSILAGSSVKQFKNETLPPRIFPTNPLLVKSIDNFSPEIRDKLNHEYVTDFRERNSLNSNKIPVNMIEQTTLSRRKSLPDERTYELPETREQMVEKNEKNKEEKGTHPGIIALFVAIAFAIVSPFGYVGLVLWKRYQEFKNGNRELLVNDFDSNDFNHFEL